MFNNNYFYEYIGNYLINNFKFKYTINSGFLNNHIISKKLNFNYIKKIIDNYDFNKISSIIVLLLEKDCFHKIEPLLLYLIKNKEFHKINLEVNKNILRQFKNIEKCELCNINKLNKFNYFISFLKDKLLNIKILDYDIFSQHNNDIIKCLYKNGFTYDFKKNISNTMLITYITQQKTKKFIYDKYHKYIFNWELCILYLKQFIKRRNNRYKKQHYN